jgi:hypothetical protein
VAHGLVREGALDGGEAFAGRGFISAGDEHLNVPQSKIRLPFSDAARRHHRSQAAAAQHADDQLGLRATGHDRHAHWLAVIAGRRTRVVRSLALHVSAYGTRTVRSPGASFRVQASATSASGIVFALTVIAPLLIASISDGSSAR